MTDRERFSEHARQVVHIDTAQNKSLGLQCGIDGDTLAIVDIGPMYTAGVQ